MKKAELLENLESLKIVPGRNFGQNFLIDKALLDFIYRCSGAGEGDLVFEIGPGFGVLTRKLLDSGAEVIAVEIDKRIHEYLGKNIESGDFRLLRADACRIDIDSLVRGDREFRCIANLPYSITSPFIAHVMDMEKLPVSMLFMLQKETGLRISARPGTKSYSALSVLVQSCYDVEYLRTVPPDVFFPKPKVDSAIIRFSRRNAFIDRESRVRLRKLVKAAFSQRRKMMRKSLVPLYGKERTMSAMSAAHIPADIRAEKVHVKAFLRLAEYISESE